jgi:hypothetical protein
LRAAPFSWQETLMTTAVTRRFSVHARHLERHHARVVAEASFEAAAIAYAEDLHLMDAAGDISLIVRDLEDGCEHCFVLDLTTGDTHTCA